MPRQKPSQRLTRYFIQGLIFMLPVLATVGALAYIYNILDDAIFSTLPYYGPYFKIVMILGVVVVFVLFLTLMGFLLTTLLAAPMLRIVEGVFERIPLVKLIYTSIKDMVEAFMGDKKRFNRPVMVTVHMEPIMKRPGFITGEDLSALGIEDMVVVYFPMSYSLTGELLLVPRKQVEMIEGANPTEFMKFIIAGGVTDPEDIMKEPEEKHPKRK
jgi:uncharacterized membrane protein